MIITSLVTGDSHAPNPLIRNTYVLGAPTDLPTW